MAASKLLTACMARMPCPEHPAGSRIVRDMPWPNRGFGYAGVVRVTGRPLLGFSNRLAEFALPRSVFSKCPAAARGSIVWIAGFRWPAMRDQLLWRSVQSADAITAGLESAGVRRKPVGAGAGDCQTGPGWAGGFVFHRRDWWLNSGPNWCGRNHRVLFVAGWQKNTIPPPITATPRNYVT